MSEPTYSRVFGWREVPITIAQRRLAWRHFHEALPETIYHYTDANGLEGIMRKAQLWATHVYYMNDAQEFKFARGVVKKIIQERIEARPNESHRLEKVLSCYDTQAFLSESVADPYVACFCEDGDLLSQWQAYAAQGQGFAIGFDSRELVRTIENHENIGKQTTMFKVIYDHEEQRRWVDDAIDGLLEAFTHTPEDDVLSSVPLALSELSFSFKHKAFKAEREWRLVLNAIPALRNWVDVRVARHRLIPYATIPLANSDHHHPYRKIIYGLTAHPEQTEKAVKILVGKVVGPYWTDVEVCGSEAPFRLR